MNDHTNFTDRLLDAGLKEYSRVQPPEGFMVRRPEPRRYWLWIPTLAAAALAGAIVMMPMPTLPSSPQPVAAVREVPPVDRTVAPPPQSQREAPVPKGSHYRTLTAIELARMDLPMGLFGSNEEKPPLEDIVIPDVTVKPLESDNPNPTNPDPRSGK